MNDRDVFDELGIVFVCFFGFCFLIFTVISIENLVVQYKGYYEEYKSRRNMMEIYELRNIIARVKQNLTRDVLELDQARKDSRRSRRSISILYQKRYAAYAELVRGGRQYLSDLVDRHNKWQLRHNGLLIGIPEFEKLLI